METELMYWLFEYGKVFFAYTFLMFVWPSIMFNKHLKNKTRTYRFAFCTTVQVVLINMVILGLGLFHILNVWVVRVLFYGSLLATVGYYMYMHKEKMIHVRRLTQGIYSFKRFCQKTVCYTGRCVKKAFLDFWPKDRMRSVEYIILILVVIYGMIYFSYGAFQVNSYGFGDIYVHHSWIREMLNGEIFSAGVYPFAMHCFIYAMKVLFGVEVYSSLLFLAGIHVMTFLIAVYCFLKEIFLWRFSTLFTLILFVTLKMNCIDQIFSMSRLQWTLPQEFGFYAMFLCALYLLKYLKNAKEKNYKDENLWMFIFSLTATIVIHFYSTMIVFFLCFAIAICYFKKTFSKKCFLPLCAACVLSIIIAFVPMVGSVLTGKEFQGSIGWGINIIKGTGTKEGRSKKNNTNVFSSYIEGKSEEELGGLIFIDGGGNTYRFVNDELVLWDNSIDMEKGSDSWEIVEDEDGQKRAVPAGTVPKKQEVKSVSKLGKSIDNIKSKIVGIYKEGYVTLYRETGAKWLLFFTAISMILPIAYWMTIGRTDRKKQDVEEGQHLYLDYLVLALASVLYIVVYAAPLIGWTELIAGARLCTTAHMLLMAVVVLPFDFVFSIMRKMSKKMTAMACAVSIICCVAIGPIAIMLGVYHSYLYYELTRYKAAVAQTNELIEKMPEQMYTVVSVTDELYHVAQGGWHEEVLTFLDKSLNEDHYTIPTEYIFVYVEKKPLEYAQFQFFSGPKWLAQEKYTEYYGDNISQYPVVKRAEISKEAAQKDIIKFGTPFKSYSDLESRTILESKLYEWCQKFEEYYPNQIEVVYEDDAFMCYMIRQNPMSLYELAIGTK